MKPESALPKTVRVIRHGIEAGLHLGAQVYVSRDLEILADLAVGEKKPGFPLVPETLLVWMSSSKVVAVVAFARLWEAGLLDLDDRVALHLPEFGVNGKESVTIRHLLTHTGGFRMLETGFPKLTWSEIIARICDVKLEPRWTPGKKAGYHRASSWFILAEIVARVSGRTFSRFVREEIFEPLGMDDSWIGMPEPRYHACADRIGVMFDTQDESPKPLPWTSAEWIVPASPASNGFGPIRELGRLYEALLGGGTWRRTRVLSPQTVEALVARHRVGLYDHSFRHELDWGLGLIPDNNRHGVETVPYGYGRHCSTLTFGHSGYRTSTAFADRGNRLVVAVIFNGAPSDPAHEARMRATLEAIYEDLGLVAESV